MFVFPLDNTAVLECLSRPTHPLSRLSVSQYLCCKSELHCSLINNTDKLVTYIVNRGVAGFWSVGGPTAEVVDEFLFELHVALDAFERNELQFSSVIFRVIF